MSASFAIAPAVKIRDRPIEARRAARAGKALRERRIVDLLNSGVSVAEIAAREGVTEKRMRALVWEILARRVPAPPAEFVALQVSRLNEALIVAYTAMSGTNLEAVDRVVRIVRELDRYHGFADADRPSRREEQGPEAEARQPLALGPHGAEAASRRPERCESCPETGAAPDASEQEAASLPAVPAES